MMMNTHGGDQPRGRHLSEIQIFIACLKTTFQNGLGIGALPPHGCARSLLTAAKTLLEDTILGPPIESSGILQTKSCPEMVPLLLLLLLQKEKKSLIPGAILEQTMAL